MIRSTLGLAVLLAAASPTATMAGTASAPSRTGAGEKGATVHAAPSTRVATFGVILPLRDRAGADALIAAQQDPASTQYHKWLTAAAFNDRFGPTADSIARTRAALLAAGLRVDRFAGRKFTVTGSVAAVQSAFGAALDSVSSAARGERLVARASLVLPGALKREGAVVAAFGNEPVVRSLAHAGAPVSANRYAPNGPYWYNDLKQAYSYPSYQTVRNNKRVDGTGASVAVLMSNDVLDSDIAAMFAHEKFSETTGQPAPGIDRLLINGGGDYDFDGSFEASLDVQQVLGGAPGARVTLVSTPSLSFANIYDGYAAIVDQNQWDVVNSSFGACELDFSPAYNSGSSFFYYFDLFDDVFRQGNAQGITFVASSGDEGGLECPSLNYYNTDQPNRAPRFVPSVSWPANSPYVTGVGGGNLITTPPSADPDVRTSRYVSENGLGDPEVPYDRAGLGVPVAGGYWGAGGGRSTYYAKPQWQSLINTGSTTQRTVPDVGMLVGGCPGSRSLPGCGANDDRSSVLVYNDGGIYGLIGTSVSSPEFVGAMALFIGQSGRQGNFGPFLYRAGRDQSRGGPVVYHRNQPSFDGYWSNTFPAHGYDYIFGNGSPIVKNLFGFTEAAPAGDPRTISNP